MKAICFIVLGCCILGSTGGFAQDKETILAEADVADPFQKKFRWGISFGQQWGIIKGSDLPQNYFAKPCLGVNVREEYYFSSFVGVSAGFGILQRGSGIKNVDNYGGAFTHPWEVPQYDADSTYRERLRFNTWEIPVAILLRTPNITKGIRLTGSAGLSFYKVQWTKDIFLSVEDGYHRITDVSPDYLKSDIATQFSLGADIDAANSCVFQVHLIYSRGLGNVYKSGPGDGKLVNYGVRVSWLF